MKVDRNRANEIARDRVYRRSVDSEVAEAILIGVREQTEWLMELVCGKCGEIGHEDYECSKPPIDPLFQLNLCTRAEYLHRKGEKP